MLSLLLFATVITAPPVDSFQAEEQTVSLEQLAAYRGDVSTQSGGDVSTQRGNPPPPPPPPPGVPEPGTIALLSLGGAALLARRALLK